jgi:PAS domain S-box-containing protein
MARAVYTRETEIRKGVVPQREGDVVVLQEGTGAGLRVALPESLLEEKMKSSELPFLEAMKVAVIITDSVGVIRYWNPFARELYGWSAEEVIGRNIMEITVTKGTKQEAEQHMKALREGQRWTGEFEVRCKDGGFLTALVTLSPRRDESGATTGIIGVSQDLSGRKRTEEELRSERAELEKRVQERTAELDAANKSLRELSARLLQTRDQEARRLARELHDSAGQLLAAISMNTAKVKAQAHKLDEDGKRAVTENLGMIEQISSEIRTISHLLHPPLLDELGLASALRWYVKGFSERSKITVEVEIPPDLGRLPTEQEIAIFRIVQECLTNIHRHADSKTAAIRIRRDVERIVVVAEDSGKGIPTEKLQSSSGGWGGVGFRGMHERIRYLGGKLELHSDSNGTVVTAIVPLEQANAARAGK